MSTSRTWSRAVVAPFVAGTAFWIVFVARGVELADGTWYYSLFDDAMISMRFGQNLAHGHGLVWNAGQPPAEGYTNLLWTLLMGVLQMTGLPDKVVALVIAVLGIGLLVGVMLLVRSIALRIGDGDRRVAVGALWLTAAFYPLAYWTLRGMEVGVVALVVLGALRLLLDLGDRVSGRKLAGLAALAVVGVFTRPDTAVFLVVLALTFLFTHRRMRHVSLWLVGIGAPVAAFGVQTALRYRWYGELVPITYTLKVGGTSVVERAGRGALVVFVVVAGQLVLTLALAGVACVRSTGPTRARMILLVSPFFTAAAYVVWVGGDAWEWMNLANRFFAAAVPPLFVAAAYGAVQLADGLRGHRSRRALHVSAMGTLAIAAVFFFELVPTSSRLAEAGNGANLARASALVVGAMILLATSYVMRERPRQGNVLFVGVLVAAIVITGLSPIFDWVPDGGKEMLSDKRTARMGTLLRDAVPADTTIAVTHAGNVVFFSGLPGDDLFGKSDAVVAQGAPKRFYPGHGKWDFEHSIVELRPALILELVGGYTPEQRSRLEGLGYVHLDGDVYYDPARVDGARLAAVVRQAEWDQPSVSGV